MFYWIFLYIHVVDLQQVLMHLQEKVLGFIKLLHDSELERKRLRTQVGTLKGSEQQLQRVEQSAENMELEMAVLRNQVTLISKQFHTHPFLILLQLIKEFGERYDYIFLFSFCGRLK